MILQVRCPKCSSGQCSPTFVTPYLMGCHACGREFDLRGGFWQRIVNFFTGVSYGGFY